MHRITNTRRALALAVIPTLLAAACTESSDDDAAPQTQAPAPTAPTADTGPEATEPSGGSTPGAPGSTIPASDVTGDFSVLYIYPETGPLAAVAAETAGAAGNALVEMWNEDHPDRQVSLQVCNDEGNPERAVSCINRYVGDVDVIAGPHFGATYAAAAPIADGQALLTTATPHGLPSADSTLFQAIPTAHLAMESAIDFMADQGWTKIGLLTSTDTTGTIAREAAFEVADGTGIEFADQQFETTATDLTAQVSAIASQDVDAVFIWSSGSQVVTALRGMSNAGLAVPTFLNVSSMSYSLMDLAADVLPEELLFTGSRAFVPDSIDDPARREFVERFAGLYEAETGHLPDWSGYSIGDALNVAMHAALGGETTDEMIAYLETGVEITGFHTSFSYGPDDHLGLPDENPLEIMRWNGNGWDPAES